MFYLNNLCNFFGSYAECGDKCRTTIKYTALFEIFNPEVLS